MSWVNLPEVEPLGSGSNTSNAYSLPGGLTELSYPQPSDQASLLRRPAADGATALALSNTSLLSASSASPYPVYPLLPAVPAGMSFQRMLQPYQHVRNGMATPLAPPSVIHPRPSPSTSNASPSSSDQLSRGIARVTLGPTTSPTVPPTVPHPVARPPHQLPPTATALPSYHYVSHSQPLLPPASVSAIEGAHSKLLPSGARPTVPLASTAPTQILHSSAVRDPPPVATVLHTSTKQSQPSPTMFVSPLTSHTTAPARQTQSTLLASEPTTHAVSHQASLPLHHFAMSTPLGHSDTLNSPQPPSLYIPGKPPVFPTTAPSRPLPSPGLSSVRSSVHTTTAATTTHRGYPYSPLLPSPISPGEDNSDLTQSTSSGDHLPTTSHPPEHRNQVPASSQPRGEQTLPNTSEAVIRHAYRGDSSLESSSTSHLSSLSSLTPHGIIQSLLAHGEGKAAEEEGQEVMLQASTISPLQDTSSHFVPSGQNGSLISPLGPDVMGCTGSTSEAYSSAQPLDSLPLHSLSASSDDSPSTEGNPAYDASTEAKPSLTLQEAFLLKKSTFIQRSQERQKQAMAKAKQLQLQGSGRKKASAKPSAKSSTAMQPSGGGRSSELASSTKGSQPSTSELSQATGVHSRSTSGHSKRSVTFSSPVTVLQSTGMFSPPEVHSAKGE